MKNRYFVSIALLVSMQVSHGSDSESLKDLSPVHTTSAQRQAIFTQALQATQARSAPAWKQAELMAFLAGEELLEMYEKDSQPASTQQPKTDRVIIIASNGIAHIKEQKK